MLQLLNQLQQKQVEKRKPIDYSKSDISIPAIYNFAIEGRCVYCGEKDKKLLIKTPFQIDASKTVMAQVCEHGCKFHPIYKKI